MVDAQNSDGPLNPLGEHQHAVSDDCWEILHHSTEQREFQLFYLLKSFPQMWKKEGRWSIKHRSMAPLKLFEM